MNGATSGEIVLYTNPTSRGRIARWMLEEAAIPYRAEIVDYGPAMKSAAYLAVNPMGKVPAIRHGATVVTEAAAICAYLADAFPAAGLAPPAAERGAYYRWLFFAAGPLEAATTNRFMGWQAAPDREGMLGYGSFAAVMDALDHALAGGGWIAGAAFSAADVYVGSHIDWGLQLETIEKRPAFTAYRSRLAMREAYRRATAIDDALEAEAAADDGRQTRRDGA